MKDGLIWLYAIKGHCGQSCLQHNNSTASISGTLNVRDLLHEDEEDFFFFLQRSYCWYSEVPYNFKTSQVIAELTLECQPLMNKLCNMFMCQWDLSLCR